MKDSPRLPSEYCRAGPQLASVELATRHGVHGYRLGNLPFEYCIRRTSWS